MKKIPLPSSLRSSITILAACCLPLRAQDFSVGGTTEFLSDVKATLAAADRNQDGKLDAGELGSRRWMLGPLDADHDQALSEEELRKGLIKFSNALFPSTPAEPSTSLAPLLEREAGLRQQPHPLKAAEWAVDTLIPDLPIQDLAGATLSWRTLAGARGTVIAVLSADCPVSKRYAPVLIRLEKEYRERGVAFFYLAASAGDEAPALREMGVTGPILRDPTGRLLRKLKATRTTDTFVLDAAHTLIYRGAISDQYGIGYNREEPAHDYLVAALQALLKGDRPRVAATSAPGCGLEIPPPDPAAAAPPEITWHNRISRLVQAHCASCHREGGVAPFPFADRGQFLKKAKTIQRVLADGVMPPWFAAPVEDPADSPWVNERRLPVQDQQDLLAWLAGSRPEGDPADAPLERAWPQDWQIGPPDLVVGIPEPIEVKAEGTMPYQNIMVELSLKEDRWVTGWEVRPTAPEVVHHVLVYIYPPQKTKLAGIPERHGYLASYVPGLVPALYPEGLAKHLPAGSRIRFEIHYTPNGKATRDQTRLGLKFAAQPPQQVVESVGVANVRLNIPPGASSHPEAAEWKVPTAVRLLNLSPHMHMRGKAMRFEATLPGREIRTLLEVPHYDFNWQVAPVYAEPPELPAGSVVRVTGWFDNSAANPANPDPTATVRWGSQTADEMMVGYIEYFRPRQKSDD